jgi:hypothetical protein
VANPFRQMGYLTVDHRASPGLPEDVARAVGYDPKQCGEGKFFEADTLTCSHCKGVVVKNPLRERERHSCLKCGGHYICDGCHYLSTLPDYSHTPFEKVIEQHLTAAAHGKPPPAPTTLIIPGEQPQGSPAKLLMP